MSADLDEDTGDEAENVDEVLIWGDRADSLIAAMQVMSKPTLKASLVNFAQRKGWEAPTLEGLIAYCEKHRLIERFRSFGGTLAFRLVGESATHEESEPEPETQQPEEEHTVMANKEWISTAEVIELTGFKQEKISRLARNGAFKYRKLGDTRGARCEYLRASVVAWRDRGDKKAPPREPKTRVVKLKQVQAARTARPTAPMPPPATNDLHEDVRALVKCVDRSWLSPEEAFAKLRELVR
jgi:hypothetical protein